MIFAQKWLKIAARKIDDFVGLCNSLLMGLGQDQQHPAVHTGGLVEGGSVAVAVGISDMRQVTGDKRHMTVDT